MAQESALADAARRSRQAWHEKPLDQQHKPLHKKPDGTHVPIKIRRISPSGKQAKRILLQSPSNCSGSRNWTKTRIRMACMQATTHPADDTGQGYTDMAAMAGWRALVIHPPARHPDGRLISRTFNAHKAIDLDMTARTIQTNR